MLPKRLLTIILTTVLAAMGARAARAQWVQTNGPWGGDAFCLASTGPHLLAGTNNGLYISTNNGDSWNLDTVGIPRGGVTAMLAQDTDVIIGVAGTGAIRSTDGGSQWIVLDSGLTDSTIVSFNRIGDHLYAGTEKGIFRLNNGENDWQALSDELPPLPVSAIIGIDSTMFIGMQGVHLSTDSGLTWRGDGLTNDEVTSLAAIGQTIFAATPSSGIFRSNQSSSWTRIDSGLERPFNITALLAFGDTLFAGSSSGNLYRSIDSGTSWDRVDAGFFPSGINTLFATAHFLYAGTATNGIFRSADQSRSWNSASGGLGFVNTTSIGVDGSALIVGSTSGIFRSTDLGTNWVASDGGLTNSFIENFATARQTVFAASYGGGMFRSSDTGNSWVPIDSGLSDLLVNTVFRIGSVLYAGTTQGLFRSTDSGSTWKADSVGMGYAENIWCIDTVGGSLLGGTAWGVFLSATDSTWSFSKIAQSLTVGSIAGIDSEIFVSTFGQGIFISTDKGQTWDSTTLTNTNVNVLASLGENIFAGLISNGVFLSTNRGVTWKDVSEGLTNKNIRFLAAMGPDLYAATWGSGIWRRPLSDFGISTVSEPPQPSAVTIRSYPNPLSQSTTISFTSPSSGYAEVTIVNALGMEVAKLFSGELAAGEHRFIWNADGTSAPRGAVCNGMYQCLVRMNGTVESAGIIVMR